MIFQIPKQSLPLSNSSSPCMMTMYFALMFPSKFPCTITASQFSTSAVITTPFPTTSTRLVPGGTIDGGPTGLGGASTFFFGNGATGRGTGATAAAAPAGSGEDDVVAVVISFRPRKDFFLNMVQENMLPVLPPVLVLVLPVLGLSLLLPGTQISPFVSSPKSIAHPGSTGGVSSPVNISTDV